jgi:hypothetical protein
METWQIVFISLYGGVLAYLAMSQVQQGKQLSSISTMMDTINKNQERLDKKLDLFLKNEIDTLKELARQGFSRNKG